MVVQNSIDATAKDVQNNTHYRNFLLESANNPPFQDANGRFAASIAAADSKLGDGDDIDEKYKAAKQRPKVYLFVQFGHSLTCVRLVSTTLIW